MPTLFRRIYLPVFLCLILASGTLAAATLDIETDYRLRGISYPNIDFNTTTSTDTAAYYSQRLQLSLTGKFPEGIEIGSKITALGVAGSTSTIFPVPYPNTDMSPFIETAYVKLTNFADLPVDVTAGKQNITIGNGFIISDNGQGFTGFRVAGGYDTPIPLTRVVLPLRGEFFTMKVKENFGPKSDLDLNGILFNTTWKDNFWEIAYFEQQDYSGTPYFRSVSIPTKAIVKQFYDVRFERKEGTQARYGFEYAKQGGYVTTAAGQSINFSGTGFVASGELIGEKTKLGRVEAHALVAYNSGEDNTGVFEDDGAFSPDFTHRFDGLEMAGYGELFAATPLGSFFTLPSTAFSGIDTLNLGAEFSPLYAWALGVDYFLYAASQGPKGAPTASGIERIYGAEFTLGVELDLSVKYTYSKYVETRFTFSRYTPPNYSVLWPRTDPAVRYLFEVSAKF